MKHYNLIPDKDFAIDFDHLNSLINEKTKGIIVNNVGNPCGNVFDRNQILKLLEVAESYKLPLICDGEKLLHTLIQGPKLLLFYNGRFFR